MASTDLFPITAAQALTYGLREGRIPGIISQAGQSGRILERQVRPDQKTFSLPYRCTTDQLEQVRDFYDRFKGLNQYFIWQHPVWFNNAGTLTARKFPVHWLGPFEHELAGHEAHDVFLNLVEAIGKTMETADYPSFTAGVPAVFLEESHPEARAVVGTWTTETNANNHGAATNNGKTNINTNTTDYYRWIYSGYGFRLWVRKASNLGILKVLHDGIDLGNVDLYNASSQAAAALLTKADVPLGMHTVDVKATNTINVSSSGATIIADAIEVIA